MEKYAKLLTVFERCGRIYSRIKVQKIFYVLQSLGYPVTEKYEYRNYGPYSEDLAAELRSSVNADFLSESKVEKVEEWADENITYERYDFSVTSRGARFAKAYLDKDSRLKTSAEAMGEVAAELNKYSPRKLELMATLMFLQDQGTRDDLLVSVLQSLKPQFTQTEVEQALTLIPKLRREHRFAG